MIGTKTSFPRLKFAKVVSGQFESHGWKVQPLYTERQDFIVSSGDLQFSIMCRHESEFSYKRAAPLLETIELSSLELRSRANKLLITVFDKNFLGIHPNILLERDVFVIFYSELNEIASLIRFNNVVPHDLSQKQEYLVKNNVEYATSVSKILLRDKKIEEALYWAELAVQKSYGVTEAHFHSFSLYLKCDKLAEAGLIADYLTSHRGNDPRVIKLMIEFEKKRNNVSSVIKWETKLQHASKPVNFEGLLEKQRRASQRGDQFSGSKSSVAFPATNQNSARLAKNDRFPWKILLGLRRRLRNAHNS